MKLTGKKWNSRRQRILYAYEAAAYEGDQRALEGRPVEDILEVVAPLMIRAASNVPQGPSSGRAINSVYRTAHRLTGLWTRALPEPYRTQWTPILASFIADGISNEMGRGQK